LNYTDFLYRPRRPEELDTSQGGGALFNQAPHQVDIVRLLGGGRVKSTRAQAGRWDITRPTEGAYSALMTFESGAFASLTYSGYGHFDSDEFQGWIGEMGQAKSVNPRREPNSRRRAPMAVRIGHLLLTRNWRTSTSAPSSSPASAPTCVRCRTGSS